MTFEGREINELYKDENLRKKNFDAFEERYGIRPEIDRYEDKKYRIATAKDGEPVLYVNGALPTGDLRLNSLYSPTYEAVKWAEKQSVPTRRTSIALMGFSTGVYLRALMDRFRPDTVFFVLEPDEALFSYVCAFADITDIISHIRIRLFVTEHQRKTMSSAMLADLATYRPETRGILTPFYSDSNEFSHICHELESAMASGNDFQKGRGRIALLCRMYAWNHMQSAYTLPELKKNVDEKMPAVIVAAGPSLNKNVEELKKIKGHAFIVCTDRALSVLDKHDIVPDVVISMDAEKSPDYLDVKVAKNTYLLCSYQTNIETQKLFEGRCIFFHALRYEIELIGEHVGRQIPDHGGNVAGAAFIVCETLGIKKVILIGQDLAFTGGKHHADDKEEGNPDITRVMVEGVDGKPVETNEMWISFRDFYEREINLHPEIDVIDATEGGAKIQGTRIMALSNVVKEISDSEYDFSNVFNDMKKAQSLEEQQITKEKIKEWADDLNFISGNSKELEIICSQLLKAAKYHDINDDKYSKKRRKLGELKLQIHKKMVYSLLEDFWIRDLYSIPDMVLFLRTNEEAIPVLESAEKFYKNLPDDCESLKNEMIKSLS